MKFEAVQILFSENFRFVVIQKFCYQGYSDVTTSPLY